MLLASLMAILVLGTAVTLFVTTQKDATSAIAKADSIQTAQAGLHQMDQVLRQAYAVEFPTSTDDAGCLETAGAQPCNQVDVLARLAGSDYAVGVNCSVASASITGDQACWQYECSASATTAAGTTCNASGPNLISSKLVIDDVTNGTTSSPVFSFCYASTSTVNTSRCATGASRPTSATVTIDTPAAGTLSRTSGGDPSTVVLTDNVYMPNLDFNA
jgi:hypothetical protein